MNFPKYWRGISAIALILLVMIMFVGSFMMLEGFEYLSGVVGALLILVTLISSLSLAISAMFATNRFDKDVGNMLVPFQLIVLVLILVDLIGTFGTGIN